MTGQLGALVRLRWRMVRSGRARVGLLALLLLLPAVCAATAVVAARLPGDYRTDVLILLPSMYLGVVLLAVLAPLAAGGGNELFPPDQLVAFPVRPSTQFLGGVLLAPLNLAWMAQVVVLVAASSYAGAVTGTGPWTIAMSLLFVGSATVAGHAVAWWVVGVRQAAVGRAVTWGVAVALAVSVAVLDRAGLLTEALDRAPTRGLVLAAVQGPSARWWTTTFGLLLAAMLAARAGTSLCAWAMRRAGDSGREHEAIVVARRRPQRSLLRALMAVDRASVWRSRPLRRGVLVLGAMPAVVASLSGLAWVDVTLLPGLVCAGAGLLFGVNAFALDSSGAVWLATLPHPPRLALVAKARAVAEVCVAGSLLALVGAGVRADAPPTVAEASCLVAAMVASTLVVTSACLRLSVDRPHRADLRHARDVPAPPGTMAIYSALLAARTTGLGLLFGLLARLDDAVLPWIAVLAVLALTARSTLRTARRWDDPTVRARVVSAVAHG